MSTESDAVNHPKHYTAHPSGVECIQVVEHMGFNLVGAMYAMADDDPPKGRVEIALMAAAHHSAGVAAPFTVVSA